MKKEDIKEDKKGKENEELDIINNSAASPSSEFDFILKRSKNINKIKIIDNPVKKIDYTYSREESYSDENLYYIKQLIDKINQTKYNYSLNNPNLNSNFQIFNYNYTNEIDAFFEYEFLKNEIHNSKKAYNVHEHRKVPYDKEIMNGKRRNTKFFEGNKNNTFKKINFNNINNRRSISYDKYNNNQFRHNSLTDVDKNKDKIPIGVNKEFKGNCYDNDDSDNSMDNINEKNKRRYKKRKDYCSGLTTYDPFPKKKKKKYKEDKGDDY